MCALITIKKDSGTLQKGVHIKVYGMLSVWFEETYNKKQFLNDEKCKKGTYTKTVIFWSSRRFTYFFIY